MAARCDLHRYLWTHRPWVLFYESDRNFQFNQALVYLMHPGEQVLTSPRLTAETLSLEWFTLSLTNSAVTNAWSEICHI